MDMSFVWIWTSTLLIVRTCGTVPVMDLTRCEGIPISEQIDSVEELSTPGPGDSETIIFAAIIYRHGARTPILFLDDDPSNPVYNQYPWPVDMGQLTSEGKLQHYRLGTWLKKRYSNLLSKTYDSSEIYITSTDFDRTEMSARCNLAGMYPPSAAEIRRDGLPTRPIPVHRLNSKKDELLDMTKFCPAHDRLRRDYVNSPEYQKILKPCLHLMSTIKKHFTKGVLDLNLVRQIHETWNIELVINLTLPDWAHDIFPDGTSSAAGLSYLEDVATPSLAKLKVGPLIREISEYMNKAKDDHLDRKYRKVSIYSAHDSTLARLLYAMGLSQELDSLPYTATLLMELLQSRETNQTLDSREKTYTVRILYRNSSQIVEPVALQIPDCGRRCPLDEFLNIYRDFIDMNWKQECNLNI